MEVYLVPATYHRPCPTSTRSLRQERSEEETPHDSFGFMCQDKRSRRRKGSRAEVVIRLGCEMDDVQSLQGKSS